MDSTINVGNEATRRIVIENRKVLFKTGFAFIDDHKGFRLGKKHLLLGTSGSGKSTLARSVLINTAKKQRVLLLSTEETLEDTVFMFNERGTSDKIKENIVFVFEDSIIDEKKSIQGYMERLARKVINNGCEIVFYDNMTTSAMYNDVGFDKQTMFFNELSKLMLEINVPIFIIAHTNATTKDSQSELYVANDIKGPKTPAQKCEYVYGYNKLNYTIETTGYSGFKSSEKTVGIVRLLKNRLHGEANKIYSLTFNAEKKEYISDKEIPFERFKEVFKARQRLLG